MGTAQIFICLQDKANSRSFQDKLVGGGEGPSFIFPASLPVYPMVTAFIYLFILVSDKEMCVCRGGCL